MKPIAREEINDYIGYVTDPSEWFEVTQDQINQFADCTLDRQFIHIDAFHCQVKTHRKIRNHGGYRRN